MIDTTETDLLPAADAADLDRLHDRLVAAAAADGSLDLAYRTIDSPLGPLLLAATDRGVVRLAYQQEGHDRVLETLALRVSPRILRAPGRLDEPARQLEAYFAGSQHALDLPVDLRLATGFRRQVLDHLATIGYGRTQSYTAVAAATGRPRAVRAVGSACATNPVPVIVPCHRVLRSDGTLGGYIGGLEAKRTLLDLETLGFA